MESWRRFQLSARPRPLGSLLSSPDYFSDPARLAQLHFGLRQRAGRLLVAGAALGIQSNLPAPGPLFTGRADGTWRCDILCHASPQFRSLRAGPVEGEPEAEPDLWSALRLRTLSGALHPAQRSQQ